MPPRVRASRSRKAVAAAAAEAEAPPPAVPTLLEPEPAAGDDANADAAPGGEDAGSATSEEHEQVILQMPLNPERIHDLLHQDEIQTLLEYNPNITIPAPYEHRNTFASDPYHMAVSDEETDAQQQQQPVALPPTGGAAPTFPTAPPAPAMDPKTAATKKARVCFHCCHDIGHMCFGMPTRYDGHTETFTTYGNFCSLECAAAFNFSTHMGSDRSWEIHSWIQILGKRYGFTEPIRPAPSRYLLQMFEGPLTIEQFRKAHITQSRTLVLNIPPMISMPSQLECINTSYWTESAPSASGGPAAPAAAAPPVRPTVPADGRERKKTLDAKMNLTFTAAPTIITAAA